jgi:glycosyltransferase involved in cell wall biosynthesis
MAQRWAVAGGQVHVATLREYLIKRGHTVTSISSLKSVLFFNPVCFDVIHVHGIERLWPILLGYIWAKIFKRIYIVTVHSFGPPSWYWHPVKRALMKIGVKKASEFIFVSNFLKQEFSKYCNSLFQIRGVVIYNGVDINRFKPMPITVINNLKKELGLEK